MERAFRCRKPEHVGCQHWLQLVCERSSIRLKLAKLAGREPKRAASLCPTVLLKIAGHGAANKLAAVIPVLDGHETSRIKVELRSSQQGVPEAARPPPPAMPAYSDRQAGAGASRSS